jgi:signal transduction histidine kinase
MFSATVNPLSAPYSRRDLIKWREARRPRFNLLVGAVGLVTWPLVLFVGSLAVKPGEDFEERFMMIIGPIMYGILQRDPPDLMEARRGTERIIEAGNLASEIINRLRSLYKKASPKRELVAVNQVIGEMARMLRTEARGHGVSVRTNLKHDLPLTMADRVQLQQVLMNLMLNGIEAMKDTGGVLTVKSQLREDGQIQISIHDTGPGPPLGNAEQIFDAFFTTKPQGSGLGLAISKSIVESHCGRIWADGNRGRGATFHFTLPAAPAETRLPVEVA